MEPKKNHRLAILKWSVALALVIVVNLFFHYLIATVYPEPKLDAFCSPNPITYNDAVSCVNAGGQWTNNQLSPAQVTDAVKQGQPLGYCDPDYTCNQHYTQAHSIYNRNVFITLIVLSITVLFLGAFSVFEVLTLGLSGAGVFSLIIASLQYWSDANNWMRVVILLVALLLLIWLAIRKFREHHE